MAKKKRGITPAEMDRLVARIVAEVRKTCATNFRSTVVTRDYAAEALQSKISAPARVKHKYKIYTRTGAFTGEATHYEFSEVGALIVPEVGSFAAGEWLSITRE